jgi:hypothetical protein
VLKPHGIKAQVGVGVGGIKWLSLLGGEAPGGEYAGDADPGSRNAEEW